MRRSLVAGVALAAAATMATGQPASALPDVPLTPDAAASYETVPCVPGGPTAADGTLAAQLNDRLTGQLENEMTAYRVSCARAVVAAVKKRELPQRAALIAVTTTIPESTIMNISKEYDHDSLGLFQQRAAWGTKEQRLNPEWATNAFLDRMFELYSGDSWTTAPIGQVCQDVQVSAFPSRYQAEVDDAQLIVNALWDSGTQAPAALWTGESGVRFDGRYHTFFQGADNHLVHHVYDTGWQTYDVGGAISSSPTAVVHAGTMYVLARGTNGLLQYRPRRLTTGWADRWYEVPGGFTGAPAAAVAGDTMFTVVHSGQEVFYLTNNEDTGWYPGGWRGLGKPPTAAVVSAPEVAVHDGRMFVFVRGSDNQIWVRSYRAADRVWSSAWTKLTGAAVTGQPTAAVNGDTLWVYARTATGNIRYHTYAAGATSWRLNYDLGGAVASDPAAINVGDRMTIAAQSPQGTIVYRVREANQWSAWLTLASPPPPSPLDGVSAPVTTRLQNITLVHARAQNGALHVRNYVPDTGWGASWGTLPGNHSPIV